jgi:hypothetical protein
MWTTSSSNSNPNPKTKTHVMNTCFSPDGRAAGVYGKQHNPSLTLTYHTFANMEEAAGVAMDYINSEYSFQQLSVLWVSYTDMTQHLTTFLPRCNTSLSRSSTRKPSPKVRRIYQLIFLNLGADVEYQNSYKKSRKRHRDIFGIPCAAVPPHH